MGSPPVVTPISPVDETLPLLKLFPITAHFQSGVRPSNATDFQSGLKQKLAPPSASLWSLTTNPFHFLSSKTNVHSLPLMPQYPTCSPSYTCVGKPRAPSALRGAIRPPP